MTGWSHPAFIVCLAWIAGLTAGHCYSWPRWIGPTGVVVLLMWHGAMAYRHSRFPERIPPPRGGLLFAVVAFLGFWRYTFVDREDREGMATAAWAASQWIVSIEGRLAEEPRRASGFVEFVVESGAILRTAATYHRMPLRIQVAVPDDSGASFSLERLLEMARGDRIRAVGFFRVREGSYNPTLNITPGGVLSEGIAGRLRTASSSDFSIQPPREGRSIHAKIAAAMARWRSRAMAQLLRTGGKTAGPSLAAIVIGDTSGLSQSEYQDFRRSGLIHLFSVSGLHAGIVAAVLCAVFAGLGLRYRTQHILIIAGVTAYSALTGFSMPVLRTLFMVAALGAQCWLRRPTDMLSRLTASALVILLIWPRALFQASFQLSFIAVFTLIVFSPFFAQLFKPESSGRVPTNNLNRWIRSHLRFLLTSLLLFIILQLAMNPILACYFQQISLIAPLANLVVVPLATVSLVIGAILIGPGLLIPGVNELLTPLAYGPTYLALWAAHLAASVPGAAVTFRPLPPIALIAYYVLLFGGTFLLSGSGPGFEARRRASALIHSVSILGLMVWLPFLRRESSDLLRITFLDVGQGDCTLMEFPGGGNLLIDAGPGPPSKAARFAIDPVLRSRGCDRINLAVATHPDQDHIGGFPTLAQSFDIRRIGGPIGDENSDHIPWQEIQEVLGRRWISYWDLHSSQTLQLDKLNDLNIEILNPLPNTPRLPGDRNTESVVLRLVWKEFSLLLMGDADHAVEERLLRDYGSEGLRSTVLKAGHHGSNSGSGEAFVRTVHPALVVISCGRNNRYGHPSPEVINSSIRTGAMIHRTDQEGALVLETDGHQMTLTSFPSSPEYE